MLNPIDDDLLHRAIVADLRVMGSALLDRFRGGRNGTLWYYRTLSALFVRRASAGPAVQLAAELERTVEVMVGLVG